MAVAAIALACLLAACDRPSAAPPPPAPVHATKPDHLHRPAYFRALLAELAARPELRGHALRLHRFVYLYADGSALLWLQSPNDPAALLRYTYGDAYPAPGMRWEAVEAGREASPSVLEPDLLDLAALPLEGLPVAAAAADAQLHRMRAEASDDAASQHALATGLDSLYYVIGRADGGPGWRADVNPIPMRCERTWRFHFAPDGALREVEAMPDLARPAGCDAAR
ncbi:hypothetical protein [Luteimonas sp. gir]|uniref:hypothetical protein n=1 Tax=Luteimonas sp. gir TaxID=3127960 RepID=UPI003075C840